MLSDHLPLWEPQYFKSDIPIYVSCWKCSWYYMLWIINDNAGAVYSEKNSYRLHNISQICKNLSCESEIRHCESKSAEKKLVSKYHRKEGFAQYKK